MEFRLFEAVQASKLKNIAKELRSLARRDRKVKPIFDKLEKGVMPNRAEVMKLPADSQDEVIMAFAEVLGPEEAMKIFRVRISEAKKLKKSKDDPCWDGYVQLGTKIKDGKEVPNCVPKESVKESIKDYLMSESVRVDDQRFVRSHGKKPKGRGNWAFTTKDFDDPKDKDIFRAPMFTDYKKAKELAKKWAKKQGVGVGGVVYTMESVELDESKVPAGMKFIASYDGVEGKKGMKHTYYRKGSKMTDPVVVYLDGKQWKEFDSLRKAKAETQAHVRKSMNEAIELDEGAVKATAVKRELEKSGYHGVRMKDDRIEFKHKGKTHSVPVKDGFVDSSDYMSFKSKVEHVVCEEYISEASPAVIKRAMNIIKRSGGDMAGAYKKIEKIDKDLPKHPQVRAALHSIRGRLAKESITETLSESKAVSPRDISVGDNIQFTHPRTKKRVMGRVMKKPLPTMLTVKWSGGTVDLDAAKFGRGGPKIELVKEDINENIHVSFRSTAAKNKWMRLQSLKPDDGSIVRSDKTSLVLTKDMKQYADPKKHSDLIYSVKDVK